VRVLEGEPCGIPVGAGTNYQLTARLHRAALGGRACARALDRESLESDGTTVPHDEMREIARDRRRAWAAG
jgi:hypothetical protein